MQTLFFIMSIVFSPPRMKIKRSFQRKLVTFVKMCTKTQNNRKKRLRRTNTTKPPEIKQSHGNKTASQCYLASFVLRSFCFVSILLLLFRLRFCFGCLGGVASILETRFCFTTSSFCKDYIYQLYYNAEAWKFTFKLRYLFLSLLPS